MSLTECVDDSGWCWDESNGYGCSKVSISFCDDLINVWYNGKNAELACCVCGGGNHTPFVPSITPSSIPSNTLSVLSSLVPRSLPSLSLSKTPSVILLLLPSGYPS